MRVLGVLIILCAMMLTACGDDFTPKPKGYLRLEYPEVVYRSIGDTLLPCDFKINSQAIVSRPDAKNSNWITLDYPKLRGQLHITYSPLKGNLTKLQRDAQNITQKHTIKADGIKPSVYENKEQNAYGMVYEVEGNAASPVQFYVSDNASHFISGSVYFKVKPNYDSILPAAFYMKKDVQKLIESLEWKK